MRDLNLVNYVCWIAATHLDKMLIRGLNLVNYVSWIAATHLDKMLKLSISNIFCWLSGMFIKHQKCALETLVQVRLESIETINKSLDEAISIFNQLYLVRILIHL
ncbi:hypothetical protein R6Q59_020544, partial [Mikania micrantha]